MSTTERRYVLDTNLFIEGLRDPAAKTQLIQFHRVFAAFEYLSAIVIQELRAGTPELPRSLGVGRERARSDTSRHRKAPITARPVGIFPVKMPAMLARELKPPDTSFFLFGPRGTGKSTWIREHFAKAPNYDLLRASESLRLNRDPDAFRRECAALPTREWIVVDEVQRAPSLLDEVHSLIEGQGQRFVLSGSSARKLKHGGANLLAGRAQVRHLFPFVAKELDFKRGLDETLEHGMLPLAVTRPKPRAFLTSYVETYLREEVQSEALVRNIGSFARFLEVAARMNGQLVNVASLSRDAQVARQTIQGYFEILTDTLLAHWLPAWKLEPSIKQTAHPKFYLFDCGVTRHMAGLGHLSVHPEERGFLFETYLLHEVRAYVHYRELDYPQFYWRTHDGAEVDLLIQTRRGVVAIEMKSGERWDSRFSRGILRFAAEHPKVMSSAFGVYTGNRKQKDDAISVLPWRDFLKRLWDGEILS